MVDKVTPEVLLHISPYFSLFDTRDFEGITESELQTRRKELLNLCLVSKTFRNAFEPEWKRVYNDCSSYVRQRQLLFDALKNPFLQTRVALLQHEIPKGEYACLPTPLETSLKLNDYEKTVYKGYRPTIRIPEYRWDRNLLISLMPNLNTLHLRLSERGLQDYRDICTLFESMCSNPSVLPNLRAVVLTFDPEDDGQQGYMHGFTPHSLDYVLKCPTIKKLTSTRMCTSGSHVEFVLSAHTLTPRASNVERLKLLVADICSDYLEQILAAPRNLKSFKLQWHYILLSEDPDGGVKKLVQCLSHQKHSLEELELDGDAISTTGDYEWLMYPVGSFKNFAALKSLALPIIFVAGRGDYDSYRWRGGFEGVEQEFEELLVAKIRPRRGPDGSVQATLGSSHLIQSDYDTLADIFPPTLEKLYIQGPQEFNERSYLVIENILANAPQRLPLLKSVDLTNWTNSTYVTLIDQLRDRDYSFRLLLPSSADMVD